MCGDWPWAFGMIACGSWAAVAKRSREAMREQVEVVQVPFPALVMVVKLLIAPQGTSCGMVCGVILLGLCRTSFLHHPSNQLCM